MVHGAPDNYQVQSKATSYRLDDLAEHSIRQGGLLSVDRLGDVILFDDFGDGLGKGSIASSGLGKSIDIDSSIFLTKGFSLKMTGGSTGGKYAYKDIVYPYSVFNKFGGEIFFKTADNIDYITLDLYLWSETEAWRFTIKIDFTNNLLAYRNEAGVFITFDSSFTLNQTSNYFYGFKLVVDPNNNKYIRLRVLNITYDLSDYLGFYSGGAFIPQISLQVYLFSTDGNNGIIYLDNIILTQNEP